MNYRVHALIALALAGCSPAGKHATSTGVESSDATKLPETQFEFTGPALNVEQQGAVLRAYQHHRDTWTHNRGRPAPYVASVLFVNRTRINETDTGRSYWIEGDPTKNRLVVIVGGGLEAPTVYHELQHLDVYDGDHKLPSWPAWELEQERSILALTERRP